MINTFKQDGSLEICAVRYCLGRMSYVVSDCCDWLVSDWTNIPERARKIIQRDIEEAFTRNDEARESSSEYLPLGMDCDRSQWEKVRKLWSDEK